MNIIIKIEEEKKVVCNNQCTSGFVCKVRVSVVVAVLVVEVVIAVVVAIVIVLL